MNIAALKQVLKMIHHDSFSATEHSIMVTGDTHGKLQMNIVPKGTKVWPVLNVVSDRPVPANSDITRNWYANKAVVMTRDVEFTSTLVIPNTKKFSRFVQMNQKALADGMPKFLVALFRKPLKSNTDHAMIVGFIYNTTFAKWKVVDEVSTL